MLATSIVGAFVAMAWFAAAMWTGPHQSGAIWIYLFVIWQSAVAAVLGRFLR
jgi:hypothetical protein